MSFSLITLTQGNPKALKRTIDSLSGIVDDVVIGDLSVFEDDKEKIRTQKYDAQVKIINFPFNYLFTNGFSTALNILASYAQNNMVMYLNVGERMVSGVNEVKNRISPSYNCYFIDHETDPHKWYRLYNKKEIGWNGIIHEEIQGDLKPCSVPLFRFEDTLKDSDDPFKAWVYESIKELVYWNQYVKLVDQPHLAEGTNQGWLQFSHDGFHSFIDRLHQKGDMYDAMLTGDYGLLMKYIESKKEGFK